MESGTFKLVLTGKDDTINALERISNDHSSFYIFLRETKQIPAGAVFLSATAITISDSFNFHEKRLKLNGTYIFYRTQFDGILQSLELIFPEMSISEGELQSLKLPVASSISEQEALAVIKQRGFKVSTSGTSIKLKSENQPFFQSYTGSGSPIRITGEYWEIRIPMTSIDTECETTQVLFIDAATGEFYNLGTSTSCN